jgi:hypothetical protein
MDDDDDDDMALMHHPPSKKRESHRSLVRMTLASRKLISFISRRYQGCRGGLGPRHEPRDRSDPTSAQ